MKICKCGICENDCEYHKPEDKPIELPEVRMPTVYITIPGIPLPSLPTFTIDNGEWWQHVGFAKRRGK